MTNTIERLIGWLKANGENELDGRTYSFSCKDEPYMEFAAEWQQWDNHELLFVGYHTVVNGDVCNDPQFTFRIGSHWESEGWEVDEVTDVTESHSLDRDDSWIEPTFEIAPD